MSSLTIGILTSEQGRYSRFWNALVQLDLPKDTRFVTKLGLNITQARNEIMHEGTRSDFVWFIDDDHTFQPNLVMKLMERNVPIIQPLVLSRYAPFGPIMMGEAIPGKPGFYGKVALDNNMQSGILKVNAVGAGGMLIRNDVIKSISSNWFENSPNKINEDVRFCEKARDKGFDIFCDLDHRMGHCNVGSVTPAIKDGKWVTELMLGEGTYYLPAVQGLKK